MEDEQAKTVEVLRLAIQMEIDGKEYYLKASQASENRLGRELFQSLAAQEDVHRQKFEEIYSSIQNRRGWPGTQLQPDRGRSLRTIFAKAVEEMAQDVKAAATELDGVQKAIDMEIKTYDLYIDRSQTATYDAEKEFYQNLAAEEREHHLVLLDYYQFLKDPAAWFVTKEHPSLDGG